MADAQELVKELGKQMSELKEELSPHGQRMLGMELWTRHKVPPDWWLRRFDECSELMLAHVGAALLGTRERVLRSLLEGHD